MVASPDIVGRGNVEPEPLVRDPHRGQIRGHVGAVFVVIAGDHQQLAGGRLPGEGEEGLLDSG